jgi:hypothetical protein
MSTLFEAEDIELLEDAYGGVEVADGPGGQNYLRITKVNLPRGCSPSTTRVLVAAQPGQPRPQVYVQPGIHLRNGKDPRSTTTVSVEGEAWMQFSYSFNWDPSTHSLAQLVGASLLRFAKDE